LNNDNAELQGAFWAAASRRKGGGSGRLSGRGEFCPSVGEACIVTAAPCFAAQRQQQTPFSCFAAAQQLEHDERGAA